MNKLPISTFDNCTDTEPKFGRITWREFTARIRKPYVRLLKDGIAFAPCQFLPQIKAKENIKEISMLVYEVENIELGELKDKLKPLKSAFAIFSTFSHKSKGNNNLIGESRFRICIPLAICITPDVFPNLWQTINTEYNLQANERGIDISSIYYVPTKKPFAIYEFYIDDSEEFFDWCSYLERIDAKNVNVLEEYLEIYTNINQTEQSIGIETNLKSDLICLNDVIAEEVSWLWFPYIPLGKVTLISGEEGLGKSWLTCAFASSVSNGAGFPLTFEMFEPGNVLMLSAEDGLADTIKPRLISCNANNKKVFAPRDRIIFDEKGLECLESLIDKSKPKLVTIDPIFAYTSSKTDINSASQSRIVSSRLTKIAEKYGCAIVLIRHIGKSKGMGDSRAAGLGSIDWRAAVRSELLVGKNPNNESEKAIIQTKNNLAKFGDSVGFEIYDNEQKEVAFRWNGKSELTAEQILSIPEQEKRARKPSDTELFLLDMLKDGEKNASEVLQRAYSAGFTENNLRTARTKLGVITKKEGSSYRGEQKWTWRLPVYDMENHQRIVGFNNTNH